MFSHISNCFDCFLWIVDHYIKVRLSWKAQKTRARFVTYIQYNDFLWSFAFAIKIDIYLLYLIFFYISFSFIFKVRYKFSIPVQKFIYALWFQVKRMQKSPYLLWLVNKQSALDFVPFHCRIISISEGQDKAISTFSRLNLENDYFMTQLNIIDWSLY